MCKYMDKPQKYIVILKKKKNMKISKLHDFIYINFNTGSIKSWFWKPGSELPWMVSGKGHKRGSLFLSH